MRGLLVAAGLTLLLASPLAADTQTHAAGNGACTGEPSGTCVDIDGTDWATPEEVDVDDSTYSTHSASNQNIHRSNGMSFAFASDSVDGLRITVDCKGVDAAQEARRTVEVNVTKDGAAVCTGGPWTSIVCGRNVDASTTVGSTSDVWCDSLSEAEVESSNFGVLFRDVNTGTHQLDVDYVEMEITYTATATTTSTTTGGGSRRLILCAQPALTGCLAYRPVSQRGPG